MDQDDNIAAPKDKDVDIDIHESDIRRWLTKNPDFFQKNPDILDCLLPPDADKYDGVSNEDGQSRVGKKKIVNFQGYFIERLKADKEEVLATTREIVETSRANMSNQARIQQAALRLLDAKTLDELIYALTMDTVVILGVDIGVLVAETTEGEIPQVHLSGVRMVPPGTIGNWMGTVPCLLQDDISGIEAIYGGGAGLVRSQLLLRLDLMGEAPPAMIAFGSRDPDMFKDGLGTENVLFFADVMARCLLRTLFGHQH